MKAVVVARQPDGTEVDITEGVQALYDLVTSSMDWGSGFWTVEDALPVEHIARTCGFPGISEVEAYIDGRRRDEDQRATERDRREALYQAQQTAMREQAAINDAINANTRYGVLTSRTPTDEPMREERWESNGIHYAVNTNLTELTDEIKTAFEAYTKEDVQ